MARYEVHRLVQNLFREEGLLERLNRDPEAVFRAYRLTAEEGAALREASPASLGALGVHPILQMHCLLAFNPHIAEAISIRAYAGQLGGA
jgi:2'-aminobiphenyl-2,3-diol 1,2-dioxygenase, small subunit